MQPNKLDPAQKKVKQQIYTHLKSKGFSHKTCIAIMANISVSTEGTYDYKHQDKNGVASGLFHWQGQLKKAYWSFCKYYHTENCAYTQITFMWGTIQGTEKGVGIGMENADKLREILMNQSLGLPELTEKFCSFYIKPKKPNMELRLKTAEQLQKQGYK